MSAPSASAVAEAQGTVSQEKQAFWSRGLRKKSMTTATGLLKGIIFITLTLWICLPIFWGSNYLLLRYFHQLIIVVVDFESTAIGANSAIVGPILSQTLQEMNSAVMTPHLGSTVLGGESFPGGVDQVREAVRRSEYWGAIVTYPNCTSAWTSALNQGDASYDPTGCMGVFVSGARFYQITLLYLLPFMNRVAGMVAQQASKKALMNWLTMNSGNPAAVALAAQVPQAIATPFSFFDEDVNPINQWAASAPFEAALIYLLILSFEMVIWFNIGRVKTNWSPKVSLPWLVLWRIAFPMTFYIPVSLMFSLLFKAFLIPTDGVFNSQAGFIMLWLLNYLTLCSLGLTMESMVGLLTVEIVPFFLIFWVIINITSSFQPIYGMERFYHWMRALPFYNTAEAYKVLFYGTRHRGMLGVYYGVLIGIVFIDFVGMALFVTIERIREDREAQKKVEEDSREKQRSA